MSEAPERKYANWPERLWTNNDGFTDREWIADADSPEYIRADLARLPRWLETELQTYREGVKSGLLREHPTVERILAWHEQGGGK